jgi:hypothetical protein
VFGDWRFEERLRRIYVRKKKIYIEGMLEWMVEQLRGETDQSRIRLQL